MRLMFFKSLLLSISLINNTLELFTFSTSSGEKGTPGGCSNFVAIAPKERQTMNEPLSL